MLQESLGQVLLQSLQIVELSQAVQVGRGCRGSHPSQVRVGQGVGSPLQVLQRSGVQEGELKYFYMK